MDIISLCPMRAASLSWQPKPERWARTVVCKATYQIEPGTSPLAAEQEDINESDNHWDDDPNRSLYVPSDLVPFKLRGDVILVGSACAPNGKPVRSLVVRLCVGGVDKALEVFCPRLRTRDGDVREGNRWTKMPLLYERAAGGPDTSNPVGVNPDGARDLYGQRQLPNLQPPGLHVTRGDESIAPIGFGPIASSWYPRSAKVGRGVPGKDWARAPFGEGFDGLYFQSAPADQQVDTIRANERIILEHLSPKQERLVTSLPDIVPRVLVEPRDGASWELTMRADTLWIETTRGICTVTWRGRIDLDHAEQKGRILIAMGKSDQRANWPKILLLAPPLPAEEPKRDNPKSERSATGPSSMKAAEEKPEGTPKVEDGGGPEPSQRTIVNVSNDGNEIADRGPNTMAVPTMTGADRAALPFQPARVGRPVAASIPSIPASRATGPGAPTVRTTQEFEPPELPALPSWLARKSTPSLPVSPPTTNAAIDDEPTSSLPASVPVVAPPPPIPAWFRDQEGSAPFPTSSTAVSAGISRPPLVTSQGSQLMMNAPFTPTFPVTPPEGLSAKPFTAGALAASNAAASAIEKAPAPPPVSEPRLRPSAMATLELIWFDPILASQLRRHPVFSTLIRTPPSPQSSPASAASTPDPGAASDAMRAQVYDVLLKGAPWSGRALETAVDPAEEESGPSPPLVLVTGELEFPFDEIELLKAVVAAASSLASTDKKLKEALDLAVETLKTPLHGMPEIAAGLGAGVREAWTRANRALPVNYIELCAERMLLEQRCYQKRDLLDDTWIRALLSSDGFDAPVPTYLPFKISKRIPLFKRLSARLLVEVLPQQDQYEVYPIALRAVALARRVPIWKPRPSRG